MGSSSSNTRGSSSAETERLIARQERIGDVFRRKYGFPFEQPHSAFVDGCFVPIGKWRDDRGRERQVELLNRSFRNEFGDKSIIEVTCKIAAVYFPHVRRGAIRDEVINNTDDVMGYWNVRGLNGATTGPRVRYALANKIISLLWRASERDELTHPQRGEPAEKELITVVRRVVYRRLQCNLGKKVHAD